MVSNSKREPDDGQLERLSRQKRWPLVQEFFHFIVENQKWWMVPILAVLALVGLIVAMTSTGAAPFIYSLF